MKRSLLGAAYELRIIFWRICSSAGFLLLSFSGLAGIFVGVAVVGGGIAGAGRGAADIDNDFFVLFLTSFLAGLVLAIAGCLAYVLSVLRLQVAKGALQSLRDLDLRPSDASGQIIYFRAFQDDKSWGRLGFYGGLPLKLTEEERLISQLGKVRDVFAIGRPVEPLPPVGARRMYFEDSEWQSAALTLMKNASFVLVRPQMTNWLFWELGQIIKNCKPQQLILWMPPNMTVKQWNRFCQEAKSRCAVDLPKSERKEESLLSERFLLFGEGWVCEVLVISSARALRNRLSKLVE